MNLPTWIQSHENNLAARQALADHLTVSEITVRSWCNGHRQVTAERVLAIVAYIGGAVLSHEIRPDIYPPPVDDSVAA